MSTSGTYNFGDNTELDDLIREAYERIGIIGNLESGLHLQSALLSGNLELATWPGKGLNLWMITQEMIGLQPNQPTYVLPKHTVRVLEVVASRPVVLTDSAIGSSLSSATDFGDAANCFNPLNTDGWGSTDGVGAYIGWNFGTTITPPSVFYVGILPFSAGDTANQKLVVEYASGDLNTWTVAYTSQVMDMPYNQTKWLVIENTLNAQAWRIRKIGGSSATLAVQQLYFCQPANTGAGDVMLGALSRSQWMSLSNKMVGASLASLLPPPNQNTLVTVGGSSQPSGFYFNEKIPPTITLYPVPLNTYTVLYYTNYRYCQDLKALFNNVEVPPRFYDALVAGLSARLATKFAPDKYPLMASQAQEAYAYGAKTDFENVPLNMNPDFTAYGGYH